MSRVADAIDGMMGTAGGAVPAGIGLPAWLGRTLALVLLLIASPVLAVAGVAVAVTSPGGVLFRQRRIGLDGKPFHYLKLRTMNGHRGGLKITAAGDRRVTPVGRVLRRTKIDELPGLWNVVRGEMALVGPRPEVPDYVDLDDADWREILSVRPGLTDPVSLRLQDEEALLATVEDADAFYREALLRYKTEGYLHYVRTRTPWTDLRVLVRTCVAVGLARPVPPPTFEEVKKGWPSASD